MLQIFTSLIFYLFLHSLCTLNNVKGGCFPVVVIVTAMQKYKIIETVMIATVAMKDIDLDVVKIKIDPRLLLSV